MNKNLVFIGSFLLTLICASESQPNVGETPTKKIDPAKFSAAVYRQTGGHVARPETRKGRIVCVNCQNAIEDSAISEATVSFGNIVKLPVEIERGKFAWPSPAVVGNASLFIVDDESFPTIVSAPESRWAMVNVAPLRKGRGVEAPYFNARAKKEVTRGLALLCGAQSSSFPGTIMGCVTEPEQLDGFTDFRLPVDVAKRFNAYIKGYGAIPAIEVTYKKACEEGWAPAPTNDVQKTIWDKVHAMPIEPIKIKPEEKKTER